MKNFTVPNVEFSTVTEAACVIYPRLLGYAGLGSFTKKPPLKNSNYYFFLSGSFELDLLGVLFGYFAFVKENERNSFCAKEFIREVYETPWKDSFCHS